MSINGPNTPIVNARIAYVNGLQLSWLTTTTFSMAAGAASNSNDINDITLSAPVTNLITSVGPNGVDIAAAVASSFYAVYVIGDSTEYQPTASLISLNQTTPALPFGYDMYRRVGFILTDGAAHVLKFWQYGNGSLKDMWYDTPIATPAITTSATYVTQSLAAGVPPIVCETFLQYVYGANSAGNVFEIGPYGSIPTVAMITVSSPVVLGTATQSGQLLVPSALNAGAPTVEHKESSSSDTLALSVSGYRDNL
jgi:hypothetical protein